MSAETLPAVVKKQILAENLAELDDDERVDLVAEITASLKIEPATMPLRFINLGGRLVLYVTKDGTDQLRFRDDISTEITNKHRDGQTDVYVVTVRATRPDGRHEESTGAVSLKGLASGAVADAMMKAETKAKRRATLSICGLGFLDETEIPADSEASAPPPPAKFSVARLAHDNTAHGPIDKATRDRLDAATRALSKPQQEWLKGWVADHPGPDGKAFPVQWKDFTPDHVPILEEWIGMARSYSPPCEDDNALQ